MRMTLFVKNGGMEIFTRKYQSLVGLIFLIVPSFSPLGACHWVLALPHPLTSHMKKELRREWVSSVKIIGTNHTFSPISFSVPYIRQSLRFLSFYIHHHYYSNPKFSSYSSKMHHEEQVLEAEG